MIIKLKVKNKLKLIDIQIWKVGIPISVRQHREILTMKRVHQGDRNNACASLLSLRGIK